MRIKAVFFDFDGTILDTNDIKLDTFYEVVKDIDNGKKYLNDLLNMPDTGDRFDIFKKLAKIIDFNNSSIIERDLISKYTLITNQKISIAREVEGVSCFIKSLFHAGILVFISSATPELYLKNLVNIRNFSKYICDVYGSPKEKEDHIRFIMKRKRILPKEILYIGDSQVDFDAAMTVGCEFIGVILKNSRFKNKPKFTINNFYQIDTIFEDINLTKEDDK
ncbi:HAD family hydrolase [Prochlorococcus sp. MIT 1011]|uniref:HAD family hydrolase n=1 Tax=Prochlorococcus sp. MIT 1011 TaxID=3082520 RepID=UPI0039B66CE6